jgi:hypothetical protein
VTQVATASAVVAAGVAAAAYGGSSALQHLAAGREETAAPLEVGLLGRLIRSSTWLWGQALSVLGVIAQTFALRFAVILVVQPLLVLGLPVAVVLRSWLGRRPAPRKDVAACVLCAAAVCTFVLATSVVVHPPVPLAVGPLVLSAALVVSACGLAVALTRSRAAAIVSGAAAGILLGIASVLLRSALINLHSSRTAALIATVLLCAMAGLLGLLIAQTAFQRSSLAAPLAALTLTEPIAAIALAYPVLGESASYSAASGLIALTAAAIGGFCVFALAGASEGQDLPNASASSGEAARFGTTEGER